MPVEPSFGFETPGYKAGLMPRSTFLLLLEAAMDTGELKFARQAAINWLAVYPGDLEINAYLARMFVQEGKIRQGIQIFEKIASLDPEDIMVQKWLANAYAKMDLSEAQKAYIHVFILGERVDPSISMPGWSIILRNARRALSEGNIETAETYLYQALALNQDDILAGITHVRIVKELKDKASLVKFAELYHHRWPDCIVFKLGLAEARLEAGEEAEAVNLLHQCVATDAAGRVAVRYWGENHLYQPLWPDVFETRYDLAIPAKVVARLGWNQLTAVSQSAEADAAVRLPEREEIKPELCQEVAEEAAKPSQVDATPENVRPENEAVADLKRPQPKTPEWLKEAEVEFEAIARRMKSNAIAKSDGRYPIYVVYSTKTGLRAQYGDQTLGVMYKEMNQLAEAVRKRPGWGAMVFYPVDIECTGKLGMQTTSGIDPWKLKLALIDLDQALGKKGGRIGALIIVGGPEVVPFHRLPNPTDDMDEEVLSDNPYSTLDSNYFIPEWPVGRLPGEKGPDAGLLLQQIRQAVNYHQKADKAPKNLYRTNFLLLLLQLFFRNRQTTNPTSSFGYTASVWRRSSLATFRPVGEGKDLLVSPPIETRAFNPQKLVQSRLGFYNLHGLAETAEWYGQRDPLDLNGGPEYPVALSLNDLPKNGHSPRIIFSEACYGGYIMGKDEKSSLALRFLSIGAMSVVGSTCVSYGAVSAPLVGADLLAFLFWSAVRDGYSVGDALTQAKISMAREMHRRQGYLDGEDQGTLISFVLYGDPLAYSEPQKVNQKRLLRFQKHMSVKTISDHPEGNAGESQVPDHFIRQAKEVVAPYLPGLDHAALSVNFQQVEMEGKIHRGGIRPAGHKAAQKQVTDRTVVVFKRKVNIGEHVHTTFARVTLDREGKLMKMAFSR